MAHILDKIVAGFHSEIFLGGSGGGGGGVKDVITDQVMNLSNFVAMK